jgi:hypothetical protein
MNTNSAYLPNWSDHRSNTDLCSFSDEKVLSHLLFHSTFLTEESTTNLILNIRKPKARVPM